MEGTGVDSICISAYPSEQFIPQRNNPANNNEKAFAVVGPTLDSTSQSTERGLSKDLGAGANAGLRTEITFVTNNPLFELVWSPHKGLSLKCADFSLAESRASIFWSTESGNMVVSPPHSLKAKDNDKDGTAAQGLCGDMKLLRTRTEVLVLDLDHMGNDKEEGDKHCPREAGTIVDMGKDKEIIRTLPNKFWSPGSYKGSADSLQCKPQESSSGSAPVQFKHEDSHKGTYSSHPEESGDVGNRDLRQGAPTGSKSSALKNHDCIRSPKPLSDGRQSNSPSAPRENNEMENPKWVKLSSIDKLESSAENDVQQSNVVVEDGHAFAKGGIYVISSQPEEEGENILEQNPEIPSMLNDVNPTEATPCGSGTPSTPRKGKEKVLPDIDVDQNVSKEEDGSHESVESSNSGGKFSSGKRAWCFEQRLFITSKKMKKQCQETTCSTSFFGHDGSFINYISNMMKGSSKFNLGETSPEISGRPAHDRSSSHDSHVLLQDKNPGPSCRPMGFQCIFKALYCPSLKVQEKKTCSLDNRVHAESPKELEVAKKTLCNGGSMHVSSNGEDDVKLLQLVPLSNPEVYQAGERPSGQLDIPSADATGVNDKLKVDLKYDHNSCNVAPVIERDAWTSGCFFQNNSISPVECKAFSKHDSTDQIKSLNLTTNRSNLLDSLWITRFSPKVSAPLLNSRQCNPDMVTAIEVSTDCNRFLPLSQNVVSASNGLNHVENGHGSSAKDETNPASKTTQIFSIGHTASCGLKRNRAPSDQKFNSKLSPILPSEQFEKSEAMASIFARRLDALKHVNISCSKSTDGETHPSIKCIFCGSRSHLLRDCADDLLRNTNLYNGAEELPCLCIRCLQLNHLAVVCPYAPSVKHRTITGSSSLNGKCQLVGANAVSQWESSRVENELACGRASGTMVLNRSSSADKMDIRGNDCHCILAEKNTSGEFILNGKHPSSFAKENGLKESKIIPLSYVQRQTMNVPRRLFEAIRKLCLSRSDILKWMKSSVQEFTIEGFFLRLRLGKWEEGLGGTGYHVACINGVSLERSCGICRTAISVDIGGLKCFVDCRYVSNHDFLEDELMAWWCKSSKGYGRVPSEEALSMKLLERSTYGF